MGAGTRLIQHAEYRKTLEEGAGAGEDELWQHIANRTKLPKGGAASKNVNTEMRTIS